MVDATGFKDAAIYGSQSALRMIFNAKIDRSVGFEQSIRIAFDPNTDSITFSFRPYECDRNHRWDCEFFGMALKVCFENLKESCQIDHRKRTSLTKLPKSMFDSWRTAKRTTVSGRCDNSSFNFAEETHGRGEQEEKEEELSWWKKDRKKDR
ncbi:hypothetical protein V1477_006836 [Vespula maculifrons]|uniref:Uncharacterized protein n=1 Tax=Vespula maculifrons TaxID=7453 RepID=A0ABD2CGT9_VESMC